MAHLGDVGKRPYEIARLVWIWGRANFSYVEGELTLAGREIETFSAQTLFPVIYTLGSRALGGIPQWEDYLKEWAESVKEQEALAEAERNRFNPHWRPTVDEAKDQASLMKMGGPAPLRKKPEPKKEPEGGE